MNIFFRQCFRLDELKSAKSRQELVNGLNDSDNTDVHRVLTLNKADF